MYEDQIKTMLINIGISQNTELFYCIEIGVAKYLKDKELDIGQVQEFILGDFQKRGENPQIFFKDHQNNHKSCTDKLKFITDKIDEFRKENA